MTEFDPASRSRVLVDVVLDFDPEDSDVELSIDGQWHDAEWLDEPMHLNGLWTQTAQTTTYFAGPDADLGTATLLTRAAHVVQLRVTTGLQISVTDCDTLHVR